MDTKRLTRNVTGYLAVLLAAAGIVYGVVALHPDLQVGEVTSLSVSYTGESAYEATVQVDVDGAVVTAGAEISATPQARDLVLLTRKASEEWQVHPAGAAMALAATPFTYGLPWLLGAAITGVAAIGAIQLSREAADTEATKVA